MVVVRQSGIQQDGEVYVGSTHEPIQQAVDYLKSIGGGKVFIEKGIYLINNTDNGGYSESGLMVGCLGIRLYPNIEIYGEGIGTVLKPDFDSSGRPAVISIYSNDDDMDNNIDNIYIHDLIIGNNESIRLGYYGIYCRNVGKGNTAGYLHTATKSYEMNTVGRKISNKMGVRIDNCIIQNNVNSGIFLQSSSNCIISNNIIQNNMMSGIYILTSSHSNNISNNIIQNNQRNGINFAVKVFSSKIVTNIIQNNSNYGISLNESCDNIIDSNTIQNNVLGGIYTNTSRNNIIDSNIVQNNGGNGGIYISNGNGNTINGNTVQSSEKTGVIIYGPNSNNNIVYGNIVVNNTEYGIILYVGNGNTISGNNIRYNSSGTINLSNSGNNVVVGNNFDKGIADTGTNNIKNENLIT